MKPEILLLTDPVSEIGMQVAATISQSAGALIAVAPEAERGLSITDLKEPNVIIVNPYDPFTSPGASFAPVKDGKQNRRERRKAERAAKKAK